MKPFTPRPAPGFVSRRPSRSLSRWLPTLLLIAFGPAALLAAAAAGGLSVAQAQGAVTTEQKQEMKLHYERAQRAFDIAKYADAIDEYAKVYEIGGNPAMLFNIAQAHRLNNQLAEALRFYRRYLQRAPNAPNKADVEQKIVEIEKLIERGGGAPASVAVTPAAPPPTFAPAPPATPPAPPPAPVVVVPPPSPPPAPAAPPPSSSTTTISSSSSSSLSSSSSSATEPAPVAPPPPGATAGGGNGRLWGVVSLMAVGVGGLVLASFEGLNASSKADALTAQSKQGKVFDPAIETSGRRANAIAITSAIVGGVALVAGSVLFLTSPRSGTESSTGTAVSLAPLLAPGGLVGAGASWTY